MRSARPRSLRELDLEAGEEQQEREPDDRQHLDRLVDLDPAEHRRADDDARARSPARPPAAAGAAPGRAASGAANATATTISRLVNSELHRSDEVGVGHDLDERRAVVRERLGERGVELARRRSTRMPERAAELGVRGEVRVVQRRSATRPTRRRAAPWRSCRAAPLSSSTWVMSMPCLTAVVSSARYWPKPPSPVTATIGRLGRGGPGAHRRREAEADRAEVAGHEHVAGGLHSK